MVYEGLRGQSAIEYLMTYGWMLLVVAIAGGAVFSMVGDQSIESVQGFNSNEIQISDFGMAAESLQMDVGVFGADDIELKEIVLNHSSFQGVVIPINKDIDAGDSTVLNLPHIKSSEESINLDIELKYDAGGLEDILTTGKVTGGLKRDESLVGYWTLSEEQSNSTHIYDVSGNRHYGGKQGSPEFVVANYNSALNFDGENDYVNIQDSQKLNITDEVTVAAWVKPAPADNQDQDVVGKDDAYGFHIYQGDSDGSDGSFYADIWVEGQRINPNAGNAPQGEWSFVVVTYDGAEVSIYKNAELINADPITGSIDTNTNPVEIADAPLGRGKFSGELNEVMIYDRAITSDEIKSLYSNPGMIK